MLILHVIDFYGPQGGAHFFIKRMLQLLSVKGYCQEVIALKENPYKISEEYSYFVLDELALDLYFEEKQPDLILFHCFVNPLVLQSIQNKFQYLVTVYDNSLFCPYLFFKNNVRCEKVFNEKCIESACIQKEDFCKAKKVLDNYRELERIACVCDAMVDRLKSYGFTKEICKLPTLIQPEKYRQCDKKEKNMIFYGRLCEKKGVEQLILALAKIDLEDWKVIFIGTGHNIFVRNMIQLCAEKKLMTKVKFGGYLKEDEANKWFEKAQLFLAPYIGDEGYAVGVEKAMSFGIPIIGYAINGIEEWVVHGENGILIEPDNIDKLSESIRYVIKDSEVLEELTRNATDKMYYIKNIDLMLNELEQIIN